MSKRLVVSFPGGRGYEVPLLYFAAKYFEDLGYEKIFIQNPTDGDKYENVERVISAIDFSEYEHVVFVAKSAGTIHACKIKERYQIPVSMILFTPMPDALLYINKANSISLVAGGEKDRHLDSKVLKELCEKEAVPCYIEPNIGHRMEVKNDLKRNLEVIMNVISKIEIKI